MGWSRVDGPTETYLCGDVEYEIGSHYSNGHIHVDMTYFVEEVDGLFVVRYRLASWEDGNEDNEEVSYDYQSAVGYTAFADAKAVADRAAADDESWLFEEAHPTN